MADNIMPYRFLNRGSAALRGAARPGHLLRAEGELAAGKAFALEACQYSIHPAGDRSSVIGIVDTHAQGDHRPAKHCSPTRRPGCWHQAGMGSALGIPGRSPRLVRGDAGDPAFAPSSAASRRIFGVGPRPLQSVLNQSEQFGISDLRPSPGYTDFLPAGAAVEKWLIISPVPTVAPPAKRLI